MKSKTCRNTLNKQNNVYRVKTSKSNPPRIASPKHGTMHYGEVPLRHGLGLTWTRNLGSRCEHVADSSGSKINSDDLLETAP